MNPLFAANSAGPSRGPIKRPGLRSVNEEGNYASRCKGNDFIEKFLAVRVPCARHEPMTPDHGRELPLALRNHQVSGNRFSVSA
jgi:hypothetical protein